MDIRKPIIWAVLVWMTSSSLHAQEYRLESLNTQINTTGFDEIAPSVSADGHSLYFTRVGYPVFEKTLFENGADISIELEETAYQNRLRQIYETIGGESVADPIGSGYNQDIWMARSVDGIFDRLTHPSYPLNNALPNSISAMSHVPNEVIVINQFVQDGGMKKGFSRVQQLDDGSWTFPQALNINNYHNSGPDVNMTMSADGSVLILALERDDAYGRSDLYVCFRNGDNSWSAPKNLGPYVNTVYRETTPSLSADGKTLYYASDRASNSNGGSDIFVQTRKDDSWVYWTAPKKFRYPINSKSNDSHPCFNEATGYLYFTSDRAGSSDIYRIQIEEPRPIGIEVQGIVINEVTGKVESGTVVSVPENRSKEPSIYTTNDGVFKLTIPPNEAYELVAKKDGFTGQPLKITFSEQGTGGQLLHLYIRPPEILTASTTNKAVVKRVALNKLTPVTTRHIGSQVELGKIYFEQSKANVLKKSLPQLNELADFLEAQPHVFIRIAGHTDNQGGEAALQQLSLERAEAIRRFLVETRYIDASRIKIIGFGAQYPLNDNSNEIFRRQNRRVEVEIIETGESWLDNPYNSDGE